MKLYALAEAFFVGFTEVSRTAFFAMLAGASIAIAILFSMFNSNTLAGPLGDYLPLHQRDIHQYVTHRALELKKYGIDRPTVVVLGSSTMGTYYSSETLLEEALAEQTDLAWQAVLLPTPSQTPVETMTIIDTFMHGQTSEPLLVVLGLDTAANLWTAEEIIERKEMTKFRIGLRSDWADAALEGYGGTPRVRAPIYALDNFYFFAAHVIRSIAKAVVGKKTLPNFDFYTPPYYVSHDERDGDHFSGKIIGTFDREKDGYLPLVRQMHERLETYDNVELILTHELPSPDLIERYDLSEIIEFESERYERFAEELGREFWAPARELRIPGAAYYDNVHIGVPETQEVLRNSLARKVKEYEGVFSDQ